jgi:hypothetical protein
MKDIKKEKEVKNPGEISRREAMTKMGFAAFSAATMLLLLNKPEKAQAQDTSAAADDADVW